MVVIGRLKDGRIDVRVALTATGRSAAGEIAMTPVTVSDLRKVEYLLQVNLTKANDAGAGISPHDFAASTNIIGISVYASAGVSVGGEAIVRGF